MRSNTTFFAIFTFSLLYTACKDDSRQPIFDQSLLTGRWEIDKAWRNGKLTETLDNTIYVFDNDNRMTTNLTPSLEEATFPFEYTGNEIKQKSDPPVIYTIEGLTDSLLVFNLTISNIPFRFQMKKAPPVPASVPADTL